MNAASVLPPSAHMNAASVLPPSARMNAASVLPPSARMNAASVLPPRARMNAASVLPPRARMNAASVLPPRAHKAADGQGGAAPPAEATGTHLGDRGWELETKGRVLPQRGEQTGGWTGESGPDLRALGHSLWAGLPTAFRAGPSMGPQGRRADGGGSGGYSSLENNS